MKPKYERPLASNAGDSVPLVGPQPGVQSLLRMLTRLRARVRDDSLSRNSLFIIGSTVMNSALGYAFWILAARRYSTTVVGLAGALVSAMTVTSMVANFGVSPTMVQLLPGRSAGREWSLTFSAGLATGTLVAACAGIGTTLVLPLFSHEFILLRRNILNPAIFVSGVIFLTLGQILDSGYVAQRAAGNVLNRNAVASGLKLALVAFFLLIPAAGVLGVFSPWVAGGGVSVVVGLVVLTPRLHRTFRIQTRGVVREARTMISPLIGHYFITLGGQIGTVLLPVLVAARLSPAANAYFYITWMLASVFFIVSPAVAYSLFAEGSHSVDTLLKKARTSVWLISILLLPLMLAYLLAGRLIISVFGPGYVGHSFGLLRLFVFSAIPDAITNVYVSVLRVQGRLRLAAALNIGMGLGTLVLAWVLLPLLGIAGAGWAWLAFQVAGSVVAAVDLLTNRRFGPSGRLVNADSASPLD